MPDSGLEHAHRCASYPPPEEPYGLGQVLGSASTPRVGRRRTELRFTASGSLTGQRSASGTSTEVDRRALILAYPIKEARMWPGGQDAHVRDILPGQQGIRPMSRQGPDATLLGSKHGRDVLAQPKE